MVHPRELYILSPVDVAGHVSTVRRNEQMMRAYIKSQEMADERLDWLQLKFASS
jgi:hypothetical protein